VTGLLCVTGDTGAAAAAAAAAAPAAAVSSGQAAAAAGGGAAATGTQTYKLLSMLPLDLLARYGQQPQDHQGVSNVLNCAFCKLQPAAVYAMLVCFSAAQPALSQASTRSSIS
jgi:hypothetical protein